MNWCTGRTVGLNQVTFFCRQLKGCQCKAETDYQQRPKGSTAPSDGWPLNGIAASLWPLLLVCEPAIADVEAKYNPTQGSESVKSIAGVFYAGLLAVFAFRLLTRRAKKFREEVRCLTIHLLSSRPGPVPGI